MTPPEAAAYLGVPVERVRINLDSGWLFVKMGETTELAAPVEGIDEMKGRVGE